MCIRDRVEEARGIGDDFVNVAPKYRGDLPIGPFDAESIMSYCRLEKSPSLTTLDVLTMQALYSGKPLPKKSALAENSEDGQDGADGAGGEGGADDELP